MDGMLTEKAQREIEEMWALRKEAVRLLALVDAEWRSDPQSVACFDLRTVQRTREVLRRIEQLHQNGMMS